MSITTEHFPFRNKVGRYELISEVGRAGLGIIYEAYDPLLQRRVAIKMIENPLEDPSLLIFGDELSEELDNSPTLISEAKFMATLEHPNILPIYDYGQDNNIPYMVMRLVEGGDLYSQKKPMSSTRVIKIASRLANVIDFLHSKGIVHKDIKPANILFGEEDHPYLTAFGISKSFEQTESESDHSGVVPFMTPEALLGGVVGPAADIYAFGVILFECFTGTLPFPISSYINFLIHTMGGDASRFPKIAQFSPDIPIGVDVVIDRLTRFDPAERYSSASQAIDDLTRAFYSGQKQVEGSIFLSYAHKDSEYVFKLVQEMRSIGITVWIDQDITPGSNWDEEVEKALKTCDKMILILSPHSVESKNVQDEWSYFFDEVKPVYPVVYAECTIPFRLRRRQYVTGTGDILNDVAKIIDVIAGGTPSTISGEKPSA